MNIDIFSSDKKFVFCYYLFWECLITINKEVVGFIYLVHYKSEYIFRSKIIKHISTDVDSVVVSIVDETLNNIKNKNNWEIKEHDCYYDYMQELTHKHLELLKLSLEAVS